MRRCVIRVLLVSVLLVLLLGSALVGSVSADSETVDCKLYHKVEWGQTLGWIAWRYGLTTKEIADANDITNRNVIYAGKKLLIPGEWCDYVVYKVQSGDMLTSIAADYGVTVWDIARRNGIWNINLIYVGQELAIPGGGETTPDTVAAPSPTEEEIVIEAPAWNASVKSPLTVSGFGRAFANNLAVEVLDKDGKQLGEAYAKVDAEIGQMGPFTGVVEFSPPAAAQPGRILVYAMHPRDGNMVHLASVEVTLQP